MMYLGLFLIIGIGLGVFIIYVIVNYDSLSELQGKPSGKKDEAHYQKLIYKLTGGELEHKLPDGTRIDILTDDFAIEVDFVKKFYEAIGQAVHYTQSGRKPLIWLIVRQKTEEKYVARAVAACKRTAVRVNGHDYHIGVMVYRDY